MTALGIALLLTGAVLVVAEAHVPGGVLGVAGGVALVAGGDHRHRRARRRRGARRAGGRRARLGGGWLGARGRRAQAGSARRTRVRAGAEASCGHVGVVRSWQEPAGPGLRRRRALARAARMGADRRRGRCTRAIPSWSSA